MIWQMTYTHKLPKLCSATLTEQPALLSADPYVFPTLYPHRIPVV